MCLHFVRVPTVNVLTDATQIMRHQTTLRCNARMLRFVVENIVDIRVRPRSLECHVAN